MFDGYNYILRLNRGEKLGASLTAFYAEHPEVDGAAVNGIGGAQEVTLGFYDLDTQSYSWQTFTSGYEITGLSGTIALDDQGKPMHHVHGTFAGRDFQTIGGHVKDLTVSGTCELFIHRTYKPLHRKRDADTGLNLLDIS